MTVTGRAYTRHGLGAVILLFFVWQSSLAMASGETSPRQLALRLFRRLNGIPLQLSDARLARMEQFITEGKLKEAAAVATEDASFYRLTVKHFAGRLSNREESPYVPLNDFSAMVVGVTRDNLDARLLLTGNFTYEVQGQAQRRDPGNNTHYEASDQARLDLKANLKRVRPQWEGVNDAAGLLTTRAWAEAHYNAGTNRRAVVFALQEFLCTPIERWKESGVADTYVRRDVDRFPGGNAATYKTLCSTCHASMDAMGGAFVRFDFENDRFVSHGPAGLPKKINRNANVYASSPRVSDDFWETPGTSNHRELFGWRGPLRGVGAREFGLLLANSERFKSCLAERVFTEICQRAPDVGEREREIPKLAENFEKSGYKLKALFEETATLPTCLGNGGSRATPGIAHFRQARESLAAITNVDPNAAAPLAYYNDAVTRLPKDGVIAEVNGTTLLAITGLSGVFCKEMIATEKTTAAASRTVHTMLDYTKKIEEIPAETRAQWVTALARRFWQRDPVEAESQTLLRLIDRVQAGGGTTEQAALVLCTAAAASLDSIVK